MQGAGLVFKGSVVFRMRDFWIGLYSLPENEQSRSEISSHRGTYSIGIGFILC